VRRLNTILSEVGSSKLSSTQQFLHFSRMLDSLRHLLRRNRHWVVMRRIQREGAMAALNRWRLWSRILGTEPVRTELVREGAAIEVHVLCSERDYLCAMWALKTFYHFAAVPYPLAIHVQGRCPGRAKERLGRHFPDARVITQVQANAVVDQALSGHGFGRLLALRQRTPFILKLTDFVLTCRARRLLLLDSDVLFFAYPGQLVKAAQSGSATAVFQRDLVSTYNISEERALKRFGIRLAPAINTGIAVVPRDAIDLARCEEFLSDAEVARANGFVEQTLYALCVSEGLDVKYLSPTYFISLEPCADLSGLIARHYAGQSRPLLTGEGLPALIDAGFLEIVNGES